MKNYSRKSFFEKLTGTMNIEDDELEDMKENNELIDNNWSEEEVEEEGQLTVDVHQTSDDIIIQTMVAGVRPDDLDISITRDMVTIRGTREKDNIVSEDDYFYKELYWGSFSRTISLQQEIDPDMAEATERNGLLTLQLPKIDKKRKKQVRVKSI